MKNLVNRNDPAALRLTIGLVQMTHAAADSTTPQQPVMDQRTPRRITSVPAGRSYTGQPPLRMATLAL